MDRARATVTALVEAVARGAQMQPGHSRGRAAGARGREGKVEPVFNEPGDYDDGHDDSSSEAVWRLYQLLLTSDPSGLLVEHFVNVGGLEATSRLFVSFLRHLDRDHPGALVSSESFGHRDSSSDASAGDSADSAPASADAAVRDAGDAEMTTRERLMCGPAALLGLVTMMTRGQQARPSGFLL